MPASSGEQATPHRQKRQLRRLETLVDVVYAIVLWRCFMLLPRPAEGQWAWDTLGPFLLANLQSLVLVALGVAVTIIYWLQSNTLLGRLERTDNKHTALAVAQVFCLLLFLYSIRMGVVVGSRTGTRLLESACAALLGVASLVSWHYALKRGLLRQDKISPDQLRELGNRFWAEPLTAGLTIPLALAGPLLWELGWLSYILFARILRRRNRRGGDAQARS